MIQPFLIQVPTFLCEDPDNPSGYSPCDEKKACEQGSFMLSPNFPQNVVTEFALYRDRSHLRDLCGTFFFLGGSLGTLLFSRIADSYGRKKALFFSYTLGSISLLLMGLSAFGIVPFYLYLASSWAGYDAYFAFSLILVSEIGGNMSILITYNDNLGRNLRGITNTMLLIVWGIGLCMFVGFAYLIQNWRTEILFVIALPACLSIIFFAQIQESPRFDSF